MAGPAAIAGTAPSLFEGLPPFPEGKPANDDRTGRVKASYARKFIACTCQKEHTGKIEAGLSAVGNCYDGLGVEAFPDLYLIIDQKPHRADLDYFGFNGAYDRILHGLWHLQQDSYCRPDVRVMRERAQQDVDAFKKSGRLLQDIAACMLMDEPTGQPASFAASAAAYRERFREWLRGKSLQPADLLVASCREDVRPVAEPQRDAFPALHYFTQLFRTRALGDFMAMQRRILEEAYGQTLPTVVNFSDGAVYHANFCSQGVDYFELLDANDQNAIWGHQPGLFVNKNAHKGDSML